MNPISKQSIAILAAALTLAGAGCTAEENIKVTTPAEKPPAAAGTSATTTTDTSDSSIPDTSGSAAVEFSAADRTRAEQIINENQGKTKAAGTFETIAGGAVQSSENPLLYYFTTASVAADGKSAFAGLYSYDVKTRQWSRLYKETTKADADGTLRVLKVVSEADGKVYLVRETDPEKAAVAASGSAAFAYDITLGRPLLLEVKFP